MINVNLADIIFILILSGVVFYGISRRQEFGLNMLQLQEYKNDAYLNWISENRDRALALFYAKKEEKTSLVVTDRVKRLMNTNRLVNVAIIIVLIILRVFMPGNQLILDLVFAAALFALFVFQPYIIAVSNRINVPKEEKINHGFYVSAQEKIASIPDLEVVGITGSYGKTSTKFILEVLLKNHFNVQNTPSSFNTPMGLSKIINNELTEDKEVFIGELGAYKIGEIKEVAELIQPTIGVITAIGPTHMHLFKTIENIMTTKYELIEELPEDGTAIFNYDNEYCKILADKTTKKTIRYGMEDIEKLDVFAKDIEVSSKGSTFILCKQDGECVSATTKLLGKHNISNILAGVCIALELGMSLEDVSEEITNIEPVEHRLNIVEGASGVTIIDDAFNSNPAGARAALEVLSQFKEGRKIIITPGMVELGHMEEEENYKFGEGISKVCDFAILVGKKRTEPIAKGLKDSGFAEDQIFITNTLKEATDILGHLTAWGDVVLFENDLPDSYSEA